MSSLYTNKKVIYIIVAAFVILSALTGFKIYFSYYSIHKSAQVALAKQYIDIARQMTMGLNKEQYTAFLQSKTEDENWQQIEAYLDQYRVHTNAMYAYTLLLDDTDVAKVMVVSIPPGTREIPIGLPCTVPPAQVVQAKSGNAYYTGLINDKEHGIYFSVGYPIYNEQGQLLGVMALDIAANDLEIVVNQVIKSNLMFLIIDLIFAIALLVVAFMLNKWYKMQVKRDVQAAEKLYIRELGKVMDAVKSSRHDMLNHFQVINGLIELGRYDRARNYLKELSIGVQTLDLSLKVKSPVMMVLFQSKWEAARSKNIGMRFEVDWDEFSRVDPIDLVRILSNLLDNAIEAAEMIPEGCEREISVVCKLEGNKYLLAVENSAELSSAEQQQLFQFGFTTKTNTNGGRGNGLAIVTNTVRKYKGDISFKYEQGKVYIRILV